MILCSFYVNIYDGILSLEALFPAVITMSLLIIFYQIPIAADNSSH